MSAYSTLSVSREAVLDYVMEQLLLSATDEQLGRVADVFLDERLYNCTVGYEGGDDDYLRWPK